VEVVAVLLMAVLSELAEQVAAEPQVMELLILAVVAAEMTIIRRAAQAALASSS
jgi:NADH:ubiquinone oxidoreductase subunit K